MVGWVVLRSPARPLFEHADAISLLAQPKSGDRTPKTRSDHDHVVVGTHRPPLVSCRRRSVQIGPSQSDFENRAGRPERPGYWREVLIVSAATVIARITARDRAALPSAGFRLCGVELSKPNAAWAISRASGSASSGVSSRSTLTHTSTYWRWARRTWRSAEAGR